MATRQWFDHILNDRDLKAVADRLSPGKRLGLDNGWGSSPHLVAAALQLHRKQPLLLVVAHLDDADEALDDLSLCDQMDAAIFPALEVVPGESHVSLDLLTERLNVSGRLLGGNQPQIIIAPVTALMQSVPTADAVSKITFQLTVGMTLDQATLLLWLTEAGYRRCDGIEEPGDFAVRGGIVDIYASGGKAPVRLDFFGDQIDDISEIDTNSLASNKRLKSTRLISAAAENLQNDDQTTSLWSMLDRSTIIVMHESLEIDEQARGYYERLTDPVGIFPPQVIQKQLGKFAVCEINQFATPAMTDDLASLPIGPIPGFSTESPKALAELAECTADGQVVVLCSRDAELERLQQLISEHCPAAAKQIHIEQGYLYRGFTWRGDRKKDAIIIVPHHELFHRYTTRRSIRRVTTTSTVDGFLDINIGEYVVHAQHGVAIFRGLRMMTQGRDANDGGEEYLTLEFADNAKLHVPASQIDLVHKYVGGFAGTPPLSKFGGARWKKQKEQAAEAAKEMAGELLRVQAARAAMPGIKYPQDTPWVKQFEAEFPYQETADQLASVVEIKKDMADPQPMDRLICGDVGYGKTELAMRAVFKAIDFGKQAAVLCPTTVLCEQHFRSFRDRMADFPFTIAAMNRLKTPAQIRQTLKGLKDGSIDIVIGTHRLLSKDIHFADLGMIVIDEEQKFGVEHKNKLMRFRLTVDVLTLSATPIPRTLHMAMLGLRDISSLSTPPADRRAVVTEVVPYEKSRIRQAIIRELNRGGQCFYVHNRVHNIQTVASEIQGLVPEARVIVGHGQMKGRELEAVMMKFITQQADVLVSTTIIESGIDIPTANTMFIADCDRFGLAEMHQLRGRVGRYKHRAYCYLLLPKSRPLSQISLRRLRAIEEYNMLGAGFKIAMRDMEIRGVGNLLGAQQSGHIAVVGYEMYCELLEAATHQLNDRDYQPPVETHLDLNITGHLPKTYIPSDKHRMENYRRITRCSDLATLQTVKGNITDAYGPIQVRPERLFELAEIRIAAAHHRIDAINIDSPDLIFSTRQPQALSPLFTQAPGKLTLIDQPTKDNPATLYYRPPTNFLKDTNTTLAVLRKLLVRPIADALN